MASRPWGCNDDQLDSCRTGALRMQTSRFRPLLCLASLSFAGCAAFVPGQPSPAIDAPASWTRLDPAPQAPATAAPAGDLSQWWQRLEDPLLAALVAEALQSSPDLRSAQARLREARARRTVAAAGFFPGVDASATTNRSWPSDQGGGGRRESYDAGFDASWELDIFGRTRQGVAAARADLAAAGANLDATRVTLAAEVATNYIELRTLQARIRIARDNLASQSGTLQLTSWREQAGLASTLEVEQARSNEAETRAQVPGLETSLAETEHRLEVLLGHAPGTLYARLAAEADLPTAPAGIAVGIPADALRQRPDVRAAERALAAANARLGVARAARYPSFRLSGSIGVEALTAGGLDDDGASRSSLLGGITAPIFEAGRLRAQVEIQDAVREQAGVNYEQAVLAALQDVENALVALSRSLEREAALQTAAGSARVAAELAQQRYSAGLVDFQSVLDTDRSRLSAEDGLAGARADGLRAVIRLYKALGGGWSPTGATSPATRETP
jgi:NodT family efflux transporter outer membrane factor (OMF) lipoprotein